MWQSNFLLSLSKLCEIMACSLRIYRAFLFRLWSILIQTWKYVSVFIHVEAIYHHLSPFSSEEEAEHFGALQSFNDIPKKRRRAGAGVHRRRTVSSLLYSHVGFINATWLQCISTDRDSDSGLFWYFLRPTPAIEWIKMWDNLPTRTQIKNYGKLLTIPNVTDQDEGKYMCKAKNDLGEAVHHFQVVVEGMQTFTRS